MKKLIVILFVAFCIVASTSAGNRVEIKDGWFYVAGEKFLLKACAILRITA